MKTKIILFFIAVFSFMNAEAQKSKKYIVPDQAPTEIKNYVNTHFPDGNIAYVKKKQKINKTEYKIKLDNNVELEFDKNFDVQEIESKSALPNSVIPEPIRDYLAQNYPANRVYEWKRKRTKQEIELDNDLDLVFDLNGNFLKID